MNSSGLAVAVLVTLSSGLGLLGCQDSSGASDTAAKPGRVAANDKILEIAQCTQEPDEEAEEVAIRQELTLNVVVKNGRAVELDGQYTMTSATQTTSGSILGEIASLENAADVHKMTLGSGVLEFPKNGTNETVKIAVQSISLHTDLNIVTLDINGVSEVTGCVFKNLEVLQKEAIPSASR